MEPPASGDRRDRLSALTDRVLAENVLPHLTSLEAARTSVLSRRWRRLWRAAPCLDLDQFETAAGWAAFEDVADRLTLLHDASSPLLDTFRLCVGRSAFERARRWICRALQRASAAFHLHLIGRREYEGLPLDEWPLFPDGLVQSHDASAFRVRLTTLHLSGLRLSEEFGLALAVDFPAFQDLQLQDCTYEFRRLACRSLKKLAIHHLDDMFTAMTQLVLAVPWIASLRVAGNPPSLTSVCEMPYLVEASLTHPAGDHVLLWSLRDARRLDLTGFSATALLNDEPDDEDFPMFRNLRALLLDGCDLGRAGCRVLRRFLRNAPRLETLTLLNCAVSSDDYYCSRSAKRVKTSAGDRHEPAAAPYPCENLRYVEVQFYDDHSIVELAKVLGHISKEMARPIEGSVLDGKCTVKVSYT